MPKYAMPPAWRQRKNAVAKKGLIYQEMLMASEIVPSDAKPVQSVTSPVSIATNLQPEMQPLSLPDGWTVVGRNGKPVKNHKMYDEPPASKSSKRKRKRRAKQPEADMEPEIITLDDTPSSSHCHLKLIRAVAARDKNTMRALDARYWAKYRLAKRESLAARDLLIAALADENERAEGEQASTGKSKTKATKPNTHAAKTRRAHRLASAAARCYSHEEEEHEAPKQPQKATARPGDMPGKMPDTLRSSPKRCEQRPVDEAPNQQVSARKCNLM